MKLWNSQLLGLVEAKTKSEKRGGQILERHHSRELLRSSDAVV